MAAALAALFSTRSRWFDLAVFAGGLAVACWSMFALLDTGFVKPWVALLSLPLIVVIARFPILLDTGSGAIEVGFDSAILMFLLCTVPAHEALAVWSLAVLVTQLTSDRRLLSRLFNVGVVILAGLVAAGVITLVRGDHPIDNPQTLLAVALAAACYFGTDVLLTACSVAIETRTSVREHLVQRGILLAGACFVPFDCLGYLGAVLIRSSSLWTLLLLAVPLATLLIATRAATRGNENARRLGALFDAAVRAQTLSDVRQVVTALTEDARELLRIQQVELRTTPPSGSEIGALLPDGQQDTWIVVPERQRARSTAGRDQKALEALAAVAADAFARLRLTDDMSHLAWHDLLTDLPNRGLLQDRVEHALQMSRRRGSGVALLFVDLDGFKSVNDRFGHAAGDALLVDVAFSDTSESSDSMLRNADLAMYEAKSRGKNQWVQYDPAIGRSRLQRLEMVESLRAALAAGDLTLVYQPVIRTSTGFITGVEALARWRSNGVDVPPDVFIRLAEETGLVVALGDVVLEQAARDAVLIRKAAGDDVRMSVNISAKQLREPDFVSKVERAVATIGYPALVLELTERETVADDQVALEAMRQLAAGGVSLAIDDFGVGFSSIGYLQDMPVQIIKTDLSFSEGIDRDERSCALLCSITMMGQALGLDVVVEGVERDSQLEHLREHVHAPYAQGYLLHRPMPLRQLLTVIEENRAAHRFPGVDPGRRPTT
jgi:predicted signal transduction protein with EAL and GGDEF domain